MVALVFALGGEAREIGPGARLRIALAPTDFAARDLGRKRSFCASVPYFSSAGPSIEIPKL
jgi:hypothetical protein